MESENEGSGKPMPHFICVPDSHKQPDLESANIICTGYCLLVKAGSHGTMVNVSSYIWKILGVNVSRY